jgi:IS4 transposase
VELFFKWLKCILGCRHWLAESQRGVALQVYCALIAALLLLRYSGRRPGKRAMEMIRFYLLGYATLDELSAALGLEEKSV